jgi:hypothetical protein
MMKGIGCVLLLALGILSACKENKIAAKGEDFILVKGLWVTEQDGQTMRDPQTSGLLNWRGNVYELERSNLIPAACKAEICLWDYLSG